VTISRLLQGWSPLSPEENEPTTTSQASCKPVGKRVRNITIEAGTGLIWALLAFISVAMLLGSDAGVVDFRYVGF
jgi:hypothetical protein